MLVEASRISDFAADPSRWPAKDLVDRLAAQLASCAAELARVEGERDELQRRGRILAMTLEAALAAKGTK